MHTSGKAIGIFGGTFDPVHNGHIAIARSFLISSYIDELYVYLSPYPPHKKEQGFASYAYRLDMLQQAFKSLDNVTVSDLELHLPKPSYTVRTLAYLKKQHPEHFFYLCMGEDSFHSFTSWHRWQDILVYADLLVAERPKQPEPRLPQKLVAKTHFVKHTPMKISSTVIREKISQNRPVDELVPRAVSNLIKKHKLYQKS